MGNNTPVVNHCSPSTNKGYTFHFRKKRTKAYRPSNTLRRILYLFLPFVPGIKHFPTHTYIRLASISLQIIKKMFWVFFICCENYHAIKVNIKFIKHLRLYNWLLSLYLRLSGIIILSCSNELRQTSLRHEFIDLTMISEWQKLHSNNTLIHIYIYIHAYRAWKRVCYMVSSCGWVK